MSADALTVLAGVDGSSRAHDALDFARRLSVAVGGRLVLGSVYTYQALGGRLGSGDRASALLTEARASVGVPCTTRIVPSNSPAAGLKHIARAEHAHIVVLGSRHRGRLGEALPGTVTREVLRDGRHTVVIVPAGHRCDAVRRIGVLTDATPAGRAALMAAGLIAGDTGATLRVQGLPRGAQDNGAPRDPVTDDLAAGALDLLVVAARPHGLLGRLRRRGATGAIPSQATCPVMVVPAGAHLPAAAARPHAPPAHVAT